MKRVFLFTATLLLSLPLFSQDTLKNKHVPEKIVIKVDEGVEKMSQGYNHCLKVSIPGAQEKDVNHDFSKYMKDFNSKGKQTKGEFFYDNASIKQFGNNPVDVYSITQQQDKGVQLTVFFDLGGSFLNSRDHGDRFDVAQRMIHDFAKQETRNALQNQIDDELKILQSNMKDHDNLVHQDSVLYQKIRDSELIIKQSQDGIKLNEEKQAATQQGIIDQQKLIDALKETEAGVE